MASRVASNEGLPKRVKYMVEEGKRDAPIPASGDGAGRAEGGAAPGPKNRETASGRIEDCGAVEAVAEGEGIWRRRCRSLMYSGSKLCADPNTLTNELEMDTYLDGVG